MKFKPETQMSMGAAICCVTIASAWWDAYANMYKEAPGLQRIPKDARIIYLLALAVGVWFIIRGIWRLLKDGEHPSPPES
jgi:hypothetical protein